jgi:hypothetical protein
VYDHSMAWWWPGEGQKGVAVDESNEDILTIPSSLQAHCDHTNATHRLKYFKSSLLVSN